MPCPCSCASEQIWSIIKSAVTSRSVHCFFWTTQTSVTTSVLYLLCQGGPLSTGETITKDLVVLREHLGHTKLVRDSLTISKLLILLTFCVQTPPFHLWRSNIGYRSPKTSQFHAYQFVGTSGMLDLPIRSRRCMQQSARRRRLRLG